ncbi:MAG: 3-dehydroquinate synthase [Bacteroidota bacterium]
MSRFGIIKGKFHRVYMDEELKSLKRFLRRGNYSSVIILTDTTTERWCLPKLLAKCNIKEFHSLTIPEGEVNKTLDTAEKLWEQLLLIADRKSLLINLGGGMISDIGGFAASVFKRGIDFINVPTTLLAMVDASVGAKTGVDFANHKNQLGTFAQPKAVFISTEWLKTLPEEQVLSAYAEMAKHAILSGGKQWEEFVVNFGNTNSVQELIAYAIKFKLKITDKDLHEEGVRKQLNFGHTVGHTIESFCLLKKKPVPHGIAVAAGMICELNLSEKYFGLKANPFGEQLEFLIDTFPKIKFSEKEVDEILSFIASDKKNIKGKIKPVLLKKIGKPVWEKEVSGELIRECIDAYRKL